MPITNCYSNELWENQVDVFREKNGGAEAAREFMKGKGVSPAMEDAVLNYASESSDEDEDHFFYRGRGGVPYARERNQDYPSSDEDQ